MNRQKREKLRITLRKRRSRARIFGTAERPRLSVFRSLKHISCQLINDDEQKTIVCAGDKELSDEIRKKEKTAVAQEVGKLLAKRAKEKKVKKVVFDRGGRAYLGRVRSLAEGARQEGLEF